MAKNTINQENESNGQKNQENDESSSLLSKLGQWLAPKKKKTDEGMEIEKISSVSKAQFSLSTPITTESGQADKSTRHTSKASIADHSRKSGRPPKITPSRHPEQKPTQKAPRKTTRRAPPPSKNDKGITKAGATVQRLLINTDEPEECRIVLLENRRIESFYVETVTHAQTKGNIYKGKITSVESNLQAAFVDFGEAKNGFLSFGEIHPEYYYKEVQEGTHWKQLSIQDFVRKGQDVLVEVVKEATGTKGASLTTYLSMPGRYLVLLPGSDSAGISRKIEDESQRTRLRKMINSLKRPEGIGYIIRTASKDITQRGLSQDMRYLLNLWKEIKKKGMAKKAPSMIHKEQNIISRFLRDHFTTDISEIVVDNQEALQQVKSFLDLLPDRQKTPNVKLHSESQPIFSYYDVEKQIEQIFQPTVRLPSGGSIVINPTEALVAIDVNSGRTAKDKSFDESIFLANMEAAEELARQLRLRDLGGLIVVDFIDMRDQRHIREVEKRLKNSMKRDKAKVDTSRISKFGLMQISRQKMASPVQRGSYKICEHCQGRGMVKSVETHALAFLRRLQVAVTQKNMQRVECSLPLTVAQYVLNNKKEDLIELEKRYHVRINIKPDPQMTPSDEKIEVFKE